MASVTKLVLVPIDDWLRITRQRKDVDARAVKNVEIPRPPPPPPPMAAAAEQQQQPLEEVVQEGGGPDPTPPPTPPPTPTLPGEEEKGREGEREEQEEEYVPRHDTGKKNVNKDPWQPPGNPTQYGRGGVKRKWVHL